VVKLNSIFFPNEGQGFGFLVARLEQDVVKAVLVTAAVGAGQVKRIRRVFTRTKAACGVGCQRRINIVAGKGLLAPTQHVTVLVEQDVTLQRITTG